MSETNQASKRSSKLFPKLQSLVAAIETAYAPDDTLGVEGRVRPTSEVLASLEEFRGFQTAVDDAREQLSKALALRNAGLDRAEAYVKTVQNAILADKGSGSGELPSFGIVPRKSPRPLTTPAGVLAQARRAATRKARGVMGRRQREAITVSGTSGVIAVTPNGAPVVLKPNAPALGEGGLLTETTAPPPTPRSDP